MATISFKCGDGTELTMTPLKRRCALKHKTSVPRYAITLGEQVDEAIAEWYAALGLPVPADEVGLGPSIDAAEAVIAAADEAVDVAEPIVVVPEYGTPEFWAYHRAKKAAENARRAAEGLPPLPTKKEIEAEKAKKSAEREAKKAEKEKAAADKAAAKALKKIK
jgi:hypothetical protein